MRQWSFKFVGQFVSVTIASALLWTVTDFSVNAQLTPDESAQVDNVAKGRPTIDLAIHFDSDSAAITGAAEPQLKELGDALRSAQLKNSTIKIIGHTAVRAGASAAYLQQLSQRRADAVKQYLVENFNLPEGNLVTAAYGIRVPKNKEDPFAAENDRVEIINLDAKDKQ